MEALLAAGIFSVVWTDACLSRNWICSNSSPSSPSPSARRVSLWVDIVEKVSSENAAARAEEFFNIALIGAESEVARDRSLKRKRAKSLNNESKTLLLPA